MILLWGLMEDAPMSATRAALEELGADVFFLDHGKIFDTDIEFSYTAERGMQCLIRSEGRTLDLDDVNVAYIRPCNFRDYPEMQGVPFNDPTAIRAALFEVQLFAFLDASDKLVLNKTSPSSTNNSKPYQLELIRQAGFKIPETFISNDEEEVTHFLELNPDSVFKSISSVRSIVHQVSASHMEHIEDVAWCPTLFQKVVPGINYRVHVINDKLYALAITSDKLDYRYGNSSMVQQKLPPDVASKCLALNKILGLHFSGIDLMHTPDDEWYCFEVNPSPAYTYFQSHSGLPLSQALARYIQDSDRLPS
jgi:glutathione synthase/RimK-type ligase-like ATP-grasp enzyme